MIIGFSGTGTGVGKTTTARALVRALRAAGEDVCAWKPIETGGNDDGVALSNAAGSDAMATVQLRDPVAPSVAARRAGIRIDVLALARSAHERDRGLLVLETAGGLFSPLAPGVTNAELLASIRAAVHVLVAPNRLGVLHDVEACRRACVAMGLPIDVVVLTGRASDASVATNAGELGRLLPVIELPTVDAIEPLRDWLVAAGLLPAKS